MSAVPKPRRVKNPGAIAEARREYCEYCGRGGRVEIHHVKSRASGGGDELRNLISLCKEHHTKVHNGQIPRREIEYIVRRREGENFLHG